MLNKKTIRLSTKAKRSVRAISPVIATLLMIAIAVAASLVAYAWIMGYIGNTTDTAGRSILIQSVAKNDMGAITVYVQNTGDSVVTLGSIYVDDVIIDNPVFQDDNKTVNPGATKSIGLGVPSLADPAGAKANIKVYTSTGTFFEYKKTFTTTSGGGGSVTPTPTPTPDPVVFSLSQEKHGTINIASGIITFDSQPEVGSLLVAVVGHRTQNSATISTPSISGWTLAEVYAHSPWSTTDRRVIAILYKEAGPTEPTAVTVTWTGADASTGGGVAIIQEFKPSRDTSYTFIDAEGISGTPTSGTTLALPTVNAGGYSNVLAVAGMAWRDNPGTVNAFTNGFTGLIQQPSSSTSGASAWAQSTASPTTWQTTASWTTTRPSVGMLGLFGCS